VPAPFLGGGQSLLLVRKLAQVLGERAALHRRGPGTERGEDGAAEVVRRHSTVRSREHRLLTFYTAHDAFFRITRIAV
jgi:hypothetical protein